MNITPSKIAKFIFDTNYREIVLMNLGFYKSLSDEEFLRKKFKAQLCYELDLNNPTTFNEKLQWLKLYDRNPLYTTIVDKYAVKQYVANIIGSEYIIPTLDVWDSVDDIDLKLLPNQFVLKVTHDSGGLVICRDKSKIDWEFAKKKLLNSLNYDYYEENREWPYKNVPRRIICEQYLEETMTSHLPATNASEKNRDLRDYKFFCFNGTVKFFKIDFNRFNGHRANYYNPSGELLPFGEAVCPPNPAANIEIPENLTKMVMLAERLAVGFPFIRVDFYNVMNHIYFGELTFFPSSGFGKFIPEIWDRKIGEWLELPKVERV